MSRIAFNGNALGTGTVTIASPNTNSDQTLTLPDATGTVQVSGSAISGTTGSFSGDLSFNSGYGSAAVAYGCRAWVNFNGTGTVAIRASGNVTSITDNGTGDYTVNFTNAMPDANYSVTSMAGGTSSIGWSRLADTPAPTTSAYRLYVANANGSVLADAAFVNAHFFR